MSTSPSDETAYSPLRLPDAAAATATTAGKRQKILMVFSSAFWLLRSFVVFSFTCFSFSKFSVSPFLAAGGVLDLEGPARCKRHRHHHHHHHNHNQAPNHAASSSPSLASPVCLPGGITRPCALGGSRAAVLPCGRVLSRPYRHRVLRDVRSEWTFVSRVFERLPGCGVVAGGRQERPPSRKSPLPERVLQGIKHIDHL